MNMYWQDVRKHQINTSVSKSTYGFPKQKRFRSTSKILCDSFYNIPTSIGQSPKSGIGIGKKGDIARRIDSPSPNKYNITSNFDMTKRNVSYGKFALGRQNIKQNGIFQNNSNPPPGNYEVRTTLIQKNAILMHPKLKTLKKSNEYNPGPGHYNQLNTLNHTGKFIVSTVPNVPGSKIKQSKIYDPEKSRKVPGPGTYNTQKQNMNTTGNFFNSKFQNSRCRSFSRSPKNQKTITSRINIPGPGSYGYFTDFGTKIRR